MDDRGRGMQEHGIRVMSDDELQQCLMHAIQRGLVAAADAIWRERDRRMGIERVYDYQGLMMVA
jgi:hypothetical protein